MMELKPKNLSDLQRLLGVIEGVAACIEGSYSATIFDAVEGIDRILQEVEKNET